MFNRRGTLGALTGGLLTSLLAGAAQAKPDQLAQAAKAPMDPTEVLPLWPGDPPGSAGVTVVETVVDRTVAGGLRDRATTHTRKPTLTVFRPAQANGAAVVLMPGGGYERVVSDKEGFETARWLADRGYTCFVLLYRLPGDHWGAGPDAPLQDAQRAVRLVRAKAAAMKFDPARVSIMGFSAGGHLAASLTTRFDAKVYDRVDAADDLSARPDLSCLMYPVVTMVDGPAHGGSRKQLLGPSPTPEQIALYSPEQNVTDRAPPVFLVHAADDKTVPVANSLMMFTALKAKAIPTEMHIFEEGGHGFGLRGIVDKPVAAWPSLFETFAKRHGV
ncbi:dienelactone hydrolase [Caulobacter sp. Root487D2Y]|uniref:alpha/beta hydrolase n=1 Tax=Caulobacter sp. Root487D2Y TaxID=1736547 RepID=UPI0006F94397|nr:alpha/beta hydrolase [Caulobacter sp. Root487D2Y]KQY32694.1 dienelactone hydrolase [Caulobacter sp. Root487D2Y]